MTFDQIRPTDSVPSIETIIAQHGALRVLGAAIRVLFKPPTSRPPPPRLSELDDRLRRDIGLPPARTGRPQISPFLR